jgi:hypothetical protein
MDKILEFLDYLIITTQGGLRWDCIKPEPTTNNKEAYYRVLNPESKTDLITLRREKDNIFLNLIGNKLTVNISSNYFFSVEVKNKLRALYDEVRLSSLVSSDKLKDAYEEIDRVILMLG